MPFLSQRAKTLENLFAHEETMRFRIKARRNKALASWAAELMGHHAEAVETYRDTILAVGVDATADEAVVDRVRRDLMRSGYLVTPTEVEAKFEAFAKEAARSLA